MSLLAGAAWVLAATATALLPLRRQYAPGLALLIAAPCLIVWIALDQGLWIAGFALFAFLSMFRRPLTYFARRAMGRATEEPR